MCDMPATIAEVPGKGWRRDEVRSEVRGQIAEVKPLSERFAFYLSNLTSHL